MNLMYLKSKFTFGKKIKIAVCFFGMNRSLSYTVDSITNNVLACMPKGFEYKIFGALMQPRGPITNLRSNEVNVSPEMNFKDLVAPSAFMEINQNDFDKSFEDYFIEHKIIDPYDDQYSSMRNILRELYSIEKSFELSKSYEPDLYIFLRPDLLYEEPFNLARYFKRLLLERGPVVITPSWQKWGGLNDRYALANRAGARIYADRFSLFSRYSGLCSDYPQAEAVLFATLIGEGARHDIYATERATRIRAGGIPHLENHAENSDNILLEKKLKKLLNGV